MPTFAGAVVGGLAGWIASESLRGVVAPGIGAALSLIASILVFWAARRWLRQLRG